MMWDGCIFSRILCDTNNKISTALSLLQERALLAIVQGGRHAAEQTAAGFGCFLVPELVLLLLSALLITACRPHGGLQQCQIASKARSYVTWLQNRKSFTPVEY